MSEEPPVDVYAPKEEIARTAHIRGMAEYARMHRLSLDDPETFWGKQAGELLTWFSPWHTVFDNDYENVYFSWFLGVRPNACYTCVDRHLQ